MLTPEINRLLKKPFYAAEHRFFNGNPYIPKPVIRARLSEIDPDWASTPVQFVAHQGDLVALSGGLTICGVTRYAVGTGSILSTRKNKETGVVTPVTGFELTREFNKAYKAADSDLLPRCAEKFGVGTYLKSRPKEQTQEQFPAWINELLAKYHWAYNGAGQRFRDLMKQHGLAWEDVNTVIEPGRVLRGLSDISLDADAAFVWLNQFVKVGA